MNHPAVGVYFDIGNALHAGEDPVGAIGRLGGLIVQVHVKGFGDRPLAMMPLDAVLGDLHRPKKAALEQAMKGHVLAEAVLVGTYRKTR